VQDSDPVFEEPMTVTAPITSEPESPPSFRDSAYAARWLVLAVVIAADAMDLMDSTIVNVAGPSIRRSRGRAAARRRCSG
jgi:hypothetical protein